MLTDQPSQLPLACMDRGGAGSGAREAEFSPGGPMTASDQQPPARVAHDAPVTARRDDRTQQALARSRELRARSRQLLGRAQRITPAAAAVSRDRRDTGTGSGPRPGGQPRRRTTTLDQQVEYAKAIRARLAALATELAATEDNVAYVHDQLAAGNPENAARYRRAADEARRAACRAREFQRNVTAGTTAISASP
jgi:hypothetical protein